SDLWAYRPATNAWTQLWTSGAAGGPAQRSHAVAAWDSVTGRLLLFGGDTSESPRTALHDLGAFSPTGRAPAGPWPHLSPADNGCTVTCPQPRYSAEGAWDAGAGRLRLFGGRDGGQSVLSDTWAWTPTSSSGGTWTQENRLAQPGGRAE